MSDEYPEPDCEFGVAIQRDIIQIKDTLEEILNRQDKFADTLQNGLQTKVDKVHNKVEDLEEQWAEDRREKKESSERENRRDWEFKKMLIATLLGNILALGGGVLIGWLGFA